MKKVYIGGSLFKQGDIKQRMYEEQYIRQYGNNKWTIYNPINADINDKSTLPTAKNIFETDLQQIVSADIVLVALDDNDPGLCTEIGICCGINYVLNELKTLLTKNKLSNEDISNFINKVKPKTVYAHLSDIRVPTAHEYKGIHIPYGYNQFVIGAIESMGKIFPSVEVAIKEMIHSK